MPEVVVFQLLYLCNETLGRVAVVSTAHTDLGLLPDCDLVHVILRDPKQLPNCLDQLPLGQMLAIHGGCPTLEGFVVLSKVPGRLQLFPRGTTWKKVFSFNYGNGLIV